MIYHPDVKVLNNSFTLTFCIVKSELLYYCFGEYDLHQYEKCLNILNKYISCVIWMNDDHSLMPTAGDGVVLFRYDVN